VVHQLPAHPGDWREGAALEGVMSSVATGHTTSRARSGARVQAVMTSTAILSAYEPPETIMCDYIGLSAKLGSLGKEVVVKNTFWTAYALADEGDYILIGVSTEPDPVVAGADEVRQVIRWPTRSRPGR
jgi:hypothetical protein